MLVDKICFTETHISLKSKNKREKDQNIDLAKKNVVGDNKNRNKIHKISFKLSSYFIQNFTRLLFHLFLYQK